MAADPLCFNSQQIPSTSSSSYSVLLNGYSSSNWTIQSRHRTDGSAYVHHWRAMLTKCCSMWTRKSWDDYPSEQVHLSLSPLEFSDSEIGFDIILRTCTNTFRLVKCPVRGNEWHCHRRDLATHFGGEDIWMFRKPIKWLSNELPWMVDIWMALHQAHTLTRGAFVCSSTMGFYAASKW